MDGVNQGNSRIFATDCITVYASLLDDCETKIDAKGYVNMPSCMGSAL